MVTVTAPTTPLASKPLATAGVSRLVGIDGDGNVVRGENKTLVATWMGLQRGGTTPQNTKLNEIIVAAAESGYNHIHLPKGEYLLDNLTGIRLKASLLLTGDGLNDDGTVLVWDDGAGSTRTDLFRCDVDGSAYDFTIQDIQVRGNWGDDGDYTKRSQMFELRTTGEVRAYRCAFKKSRFMTFIGVGCSVFDVRGCLFEHGYADGARATQCRSISVRGNVFRGINDDSVAIHTSDEQPAPVDTEAVISDNVIIDGQGIACLGAKTVTIHNNIIKRAHTRAIEVGDAATTIVEGGTAMYSVSIKGNHIDTVFNGYLLDGRSGGTVNYIRIAGMTPSTNGSGYAFQGNGSGGVVSPSPYFFTNNVDANPPAIGSYFIEVIGNICTRTLEPVAAYSDYGFPSRIARQGPVDDTAITAQILGCDEVETRAHIHIVNHGFGVNIANNISYGSSVGIFFQGTDASSYISWRNVRVSGNQFLRFAKGGMCIVGVGSIIANDNIFDGDPLHEHSLRVANGKWSFGSSTQHYAVSGAAGCSLELSGNTFSNVQAILAGDISAIVSRSNTMRCYPVGVGYQANNQGIGSIGNPGGKGNERLIVVDSDPASSTFNKVINICEEATSSMPSTGYYMAGMFVRRASTSVSSPMTLGWLRLTTGNGHVLGTDWRAINAAT